MALQDLVNATAAGGTLNIVGQTFNGSGSGEPMTIISKGGLGLTIVGGTVTGILTTNAWGDPCISLRDDNITIDGMDLAGGSNPFLMTQKSLGPPITGYANLTIRNTIITRQRHPGCPFRFHGPHTDMLIENNTWIASASNANESIIAGRSDEGNPCNYMADGMIVRGNTFRQGANATNSGWFGIEIKCMKNILIDDNDLSGGQVLTSFPDCDHVEVKNNLFRMSYWTASRPWLAVEQAGPLAASFNVHDNVMDGNGIASGELVSINNLNYAAAIMTNPVTIIECNRIQNGGHNLFHTEWVAGGAQESRVQNNTVPAGVLIDNGNTNRTGNGNFYFNNDLDGAVGCGSVPGSLLAQLVTAVAIAPAANIRTLFKTGPSIRPWIRWW